MKPLPELSQREQLILQAVVHTYITTAEAVGSRSIVKRYELNLSPATVRNVMADLEETGYLEQLHTSSGRVPTDAGYRYYVNHLMHVQELTLTERTRIEQELSEKLNDLDEALHRTSQLLALVSHQTGLVQAPDESAARVRRIDLIPVDSARVAVLVVDSYGGVRTMMVPLPEPMTAEAMGTLNRFLNDKLYGAKADNLAESVRDSIRAAVDDQRTLAENALRVLNALPRYSQTSLFLEGTTQLIEQPEFHDVVKARQMLGLLEQQDNLVALLQESMAHDAEPTPFVVIGSESHRQGLEEISLVASPYYVGEKIVGTVGVIGPRRMPYSKITAVVNHTARMFSRLLTRLAGK